MLYPIRGLGAFECVLHRVFHIIEQWMFLYASDVISSRATGYKSNIEVETGGCASEPVLKSILLGYKTDDTVVS